MKILLIALLLISISHGSAYAQTDYQINSAIDFFRAKQLTTGSIKKQLTESDISGSPYLNKEFVAGDIFTTSKVQFKEVPLRYNIYYDRLEFKTPEDEISGLAAPEIVVKVVFEDFTLAYIPFNSLNKMKRGFFQVLVEGNASLFAKQIVQFDQPQETTGYKQAKPAQFSRKSDEYYIRIGMEAAEKVGKKNEIFTLFPDSHNELKDFIKENKIKPGKAESLKKLVNYYNSL